MPGGYCGLNTEVLQSVNVRRIRQKRQPQSNQLALRDNRARTLDQRAQHCAEN